jgi:hypothetical protein
MAGTKVGVRVDSTFSRDDITDALSRYANSLDEAILCNLHGNKEFFGWDFSRRDRCELYQVAP